MFKKAQPLEAQLLEDLQAIEFNIIELEAQREAVKKKLSYLRYDAETSKQKAETVPAA